MVDIDSESKGSCWDCAWSSISSQSWIGPCPFELEQPFFFDADHRSQIADGWTPQTDVCGLASILFEIVIGRPVR
jgi:hypothetical protein